MSTFLTEDGWKAVLNKPKNLGLRIQGTSVSQRLHSYETANKNYVRGKTKDGAEGVLNLLRDLKTHAQTRSTSHKAFTEATEYLKEVVKAAGKREEELKEDKEALENLKEAKENLSEAYHVLSSIQKAADFKRTGTGTLNGCAIKLMKAGKFNEVSGDTMAKLNNRCTVDTSLAAVTDENLAAKKNEVKGFLDHLKNELEKVKI
jgi:hypothetical protein